MNLRSFLTTKGLALFVLVLAACSGQAEPVVSTPAPAAVEVEPATTIMEATTETTSEPAAATPTESAAAEAETAQAVLSALSKNADGYVDLGVEQLAAAMPTKDFTLVNVHIPYEGELPNTDRFIPYNEITDHLTDLPDQDAPIVLYCRSGSMSTAAAKALVAAGYTHVYELDGGFNAWQAAGYELLRNQGDSQPSAMTTRQAEVAERGAQVMPFDLEQTIHVFKPLDNGGLQQVLAKEDAGMDQVPLIQMHLTEEAERFRQGDFADPAHIHGDAMPGLAVLRERAGEVDVRYTALDNGAQLEYITDDPELVAAIHAWFAAQLSDHGAHAVGE